MESVGKSDLDDSDWEFLDGILPGKAFFTAYPEDVSLRMRYSDKGMLKINGDLIAFSGKDAIESFFEKMGKPFTDHEMIFSCVNWNQIVETVKETFRDCLIDPHCPQNDNVIGFSGESRIVAVFSGRGY